MDTVPVDGNPTDSMDIEEIDRLPSAEREIVAEAEMEALPTAISAE